MASSFVYNGLFTLWRKMYIAQLVSYIYIYIILPQHLNFHYFSLFMTKIHTTVIIHNIVKSSWQAVILVLLKTIISILIYFVLFRLINSFFPLSKQTMHLIPKFHKNLRATVFIVPITTTIVAAIKGFKKCRSIGIVAKLCSNQISWNDSPLL